MPRPAKVSTVVIPTRECPKCHNRWAYPLGFIKKSRLCRVCYNQKRAEERREHRRNGYPDRRKPTEKSTTFDHSLTVLEQYWGPYTQWTREQHLKHSDYLRQLSGLPRHAQAVHASL